MPLLTESVFLAAPSAVDLASTRDTPWIIGSPGTLCHAATLRICRTAGFHPRVRHQADDFATVLALVAAGQGVSLVPALAAGSAPDGVHFVRLELRRRTRVAYRRGAAAQPAVAAFVDALRTCAGPRRSLTALPAARSSAPRQRPRRARPESTATDGVLID